MKSSRCTTAGDAVLIDDLRLPARIGVHPSERGREQAIELSLEIGLPSARPFRSDEVAHTIDYTAVVKALTRLCVSRHFNLAECLAQEVASLILDDFGGTWVSVRLRKVNIAPGVRFVGVAIVRRQGMRRWLRHRLLGPLLAARAPRASVPLEALLADEVRG